MYGLNRSRGKRRVLFLILAVFVGLIALWGVTSPISRTQAWKLVNISTQSLYGPLVPPVPRPRVLCLILTTAYNGEKRAAVNNTWARRCDKRLFVLGKSNVKLDPTLEKQLQGPEFLHVDVLERRNLLPKKVQLALDQAYRLYNDSFDWILKCDDDVYVIMENLKLLLSNFKSSEPGYLGYRFKLFVKGGYPSGGAGYLISRAGLQKVVKNWNQTECQTPEGNEDVEMGRCFLKAGVPVLDSWDEQGRETFHPEPLANHIYSPYPQWLEKYAWKKAVFGPGCCSQHSISFHHLNPSDMFVYEHLLYNTSIAGRNS